MGFLSDMFKSLNKYLSNYNAEIQELYEKYQNKSDAELNRLAQTGNTKQRMAALKNLKERGYTREIE